LFLIFVHRLVEKVTLSAKASGPEPGLNYEYSNNI